MSKWGNREHKLEILTTRILIVGFLTSLTWYWLRWEWFVIILALESTLALAVHLIARFSHEREKIDYKKIRGRR
jgi:hypothetical protein